MNSDSILLRDAVEVCDQDPSLDLPVRTLNTAVQQIDQSHPSVVCRGQSVWILDITLDMCV